MRPAKIGRHQVGVVEISQSCVRMDDAGVEHGLCERLQFRPSTVCAEGIWRREGVIDKTDGIPVITFQAATDVAPAKPCACAEVSNAKSARVAFSNTRTRLLWITGGSSQPMGTYSRRSETDLGNHQERRGGDDVHMIERRRFRQFLSGFAFSAFTVFANSNNTFL